jgi:glycosyltransferase involved in cell wall biosynthesis
MLEAMGTGMPIVCTAHPTSPIKDGYNGFISDDLDYLRKMVIRLLEDRDLATTLGGNARKTAIDDFGIQAFRRRWKQVFLEAKKHHRLR